MCFSVIGALIVYLMYDARKLDGGHCSSKLSRSIVSAHWASHMKHRDGGILSISVMSGKAASCTSEHVLSFWIAP